MQVVDAFGGSVAGVRTPAFVERVVDTLAEASAVLGVAKSWVGRSWADCITSTSVSRVTFGRTTFSGSTAAARLLPLVRALRSRPAEWQVSPAT